jgi:hypothetical protein
MKVFLLNPERFRNKFSAERELIRRFELAGANLGVQIRGGFSDSEALAFEPDLILATHPYVAKTTPVLTLGCLWNPIKFMEAVDEFKPNTKSYDGFLYASQPIKGWARELVSGTEKQYFESTLYPSSPRSEFRVPNRFEVPVYVGTNWDGDRHSEVLCELARRGCIRTYGPSSRWERLRELGAYYGEVAFGSDELLKIYANAAIGLCLHHPSHLDDAIPNMRIFEIVSACALPICDPHGFIKEAFADTVLYVDTSKTPLEIADQIGAHVSWIRSHPRQAAEMVRAAHTRFSEMYCLEVLLSNLFCEIKLGLSAERSGSRLA